jgi:hypothetical protein
MRSISGLGFQGSGAARLESVSYPVTQITQATGTVTVTGATSLVGVVRFEVSYDVGDVFPITLYKPQNWFPIGGGAVIVNGNGVYPLPSVGFSAQWLRVVFEPSIPDAGASLAMAFNASGSSPSGAVDTSFVSITIGGGGGSNPVSFTSVSDETIGEGMFVARDGDKVIRAAGNDATRMPAVGMVTSIAQDGTLTIQSHGAAVTSHGDGAAKILFVGTNGYPTASIGPLTHVQPVGTWLTTGTLILSVSPQMTLKSAAT